MTFSSVPLLMAGAFGLIVLKRTPINSSCITFLTSVIYNFGIKLTLQCILADVVENIFLFTVSVFDEHARRTR